MCFLCVSKFESMILLYILRAVETLFMSKDSLFPYSCCLFKFFIDFVSVMLNKQTANEWKLASCRPFR